MTLFQRLSLSLVALLLFTGGCGPTIRVDMMILGPFTYVYSKPTKTMDVVFLNEVTDGSCHVMKPTVYLRVLEGTITAPSNPPRNRVFFLDDLVVTFGSMGSGSLTKNGPSKFKNGVHPANPNKDSAWHDLQFVPNLFDRHKVKLDSDWSQLPVVNGRVVLTKGSLRGAPPTENLMKTAMWDFKTSNNAAKPVFSQAMTNVVAYSTSVPGTSVVITLTRRDKTSSTVEITPINGHMRLSLVARHDDTDESTTPIKDYCAFYQLLPETTRAEMMASLPYYKTPNATSVPSVPAAAGLTDHPRPGPYCTGAYVEAK